MGFSVHFTSWSNLTAVKNQTTGKLIIGLVGKYIGFTRIRPKQSVFTHFLSFSHRVTFLKWVLPAGQVFDRGRDPSDEKAMIDLV